MAKLSSGKKARQQQAAQSRQQATRKARHQQQLHVDAQKSQRDAYVFEIQHMDHRNPYWKYTAVESVVALVAFAFELFAMNNDGGSMTYVFAVVLAVALVALWVTQRRYKAWELEHGDVEGTSGEKGQAGNAAQTGKKSPAGNAAQTGRKSPAGNAAQTGRKSQPAKGSKGTAGRGGKKGR